MAKKAEAHVAQRYLQSFVGGEGQPVELHLQLTKQRQYLSIDAGEVSDMAGLDVVRPWRRADPSVPLDVQIDESLHPITQAFASNMQGNGSRVFVGIAHVDPVKGARTFQHNPDKSITFNGANYDDPTKVISLTDAFVDYTFDQGDFLELFAGSGIVEGLHEINSKIDDDEIDLVNSAGLTHTINEINGAIGAGPASIQIGADSYASMFGGAGWPRHLDDGNVIATAYRPEIISTVGGEDDKKPIGFRITGVKTRNNPNDTIEIDQDLVNDSAFIIVALKEASLRGIIITDGREFRLLQGGKYQSEPLLVVEEAQKGDIWRMAKISNSRLLLVSDKNIPRVITLGGIQPEQILAAQKDVSYVAPNSSIANASPFLDVIDGDVAPSGGSTINTQHIVAHIDDVDAGKFSSPLDVIFTATFARLKREMTGVESSGGFAAQVKFEHAGRGMARYAGPPPIITSIADDAGPNEAIHMDTENPIDVANTITEGDVSVLIRLLDRETNAASPFFQAGAGLSEADNGREAILEYPAGSADRRLNLQFMRGDFIFPHRSHLVQIWRKLSNGSDYFLEKEIPAICFGSATFGDFTTDQDPPGNRSFRVELTLLDDDLDKRPILENNDRIRGVPPAGRDVAVLTDTGTVLIAGKTDLSRFKNPVWGDGRYKYNWPKVDGDNVVHFSRTDKREPENFPPLIVNQITLSRIGDKFQRFVQAGDDILAVMSEGVYRLSSGGPLGVERHVLGETGIGTPWPDSVISIRRKALWVGSSNVYLYDRSAEGTERPPLTTVGDDLYPWIRSAAKDGDDIRSSFDPRRQVVIIRRIKTNGVYQDVEMALRGNAMTFMDGRYAADFAASPHAGAVEENHGILYAVGEQGDVRELGREEEVGDAHPYDGLTNQVVLDGTHTIDDGSVTKTGEFSTAMIGDAIRFKSTNAAVDGQVRKIKSVSLVQDSDTVHTNSDMTSLVMIDSRNGFLGTIDIDSIPILSIWKIAIRDNGLLTVHSSARISVGSGNRSLSIVPWGIGMAFVTIDGSNRPISGAIRTSDEVLYPITENTLTILEHGIAREKVAATNIDGHNMIQVWKSTTADNYRIDIVAVAIGEDGSIKKPETANITQVSDGDSTTDPAICRLSDTIALASFNQGGEFKISVITFDGELITEITTTLVSASTSGSSFIICITPTEFVILYGDVGTNFKARHGTIDTDPDSGSYGAITYGAELTIFTGVSTGNHIGCRMTDTRLVVSYTWAPGPVFQVLTVNADKSLSITGVASLAGDVVKHEVVRLTDTRFFYTVVYSGDTTVYAIPGVVYGQELLKVNVAITHGPPDTIAFDNVPGLAEGDTIIIGAVPFRIRFAPVAGQRVRNPKILDGISAWIKPDGKTVTTTKTMTMRIHRNLSDDDEVLNRAGDTEIEIPIKAPSEVSTIDEALFAGIHVEGKMLEVSISNDDADVGLSIVNLDGAVKETGDPIEDRSTAR